MQLEVLEKHPIAEVTSINNMFLLIYLCIPTAGLICV